MRFTGLDPRAPGPRGNCTLRRFSGNYASGCLLVERQWGGGRSWVRPAPIRIMESPGSPLSGISPTWSAQIRAVTQPSKGPMKQQPLWSSLTKNDSPGAFRQGRKAPVSSRS